MSRHRQIPSDFTVDQAYCSCFLSRFFRGWHHTPPLKKFGSGVEVNAQSCRFSTYDFDLLTRLVIMAHSYAVRVELGDGGPGRVKLIAHRRKHDPCIPGEGLQQHERHPDLDRLIELVSTYKSSRGQGIEESEVLP